jgi:hypothetical protein
MEGLARPLRAVLLAPPPLFLKHQVNPAERGPRVPTALAYELRRQV